MRLGASDEHTPVNVGNPTEFTMLECAREVLAVTGSSSPGWSSSRCHRMIPRGAARTLHGLRTLLGWEPKIPLREGLERSLAYFKACVSA